MIDSTFSVSMHVHIADIKIDLCIFIIYMCNGFAFMQVVYWQKEQATKIVIFRNVFVTNGDKKKRETSTCSSLTLGIPLILTSFFKH